jgi:hypothetical protein
MNHDAAQRLIDARELTCGHWMRTHKPTLFLGLLQATRHTEKLSHRKLQENSYRQSGSIGMHSDPKTQLLRVHIKSRLQRVVKRKNRNIR